MSSSSSSSSSSSNINNEASSHKELQHVSPSDNRNNNNKNNKNKDKNESTTTSTLQMLSMDCHGADDGPRSSWRNDPLQEEENDGLEREVYSKPSPWWKRRIRDFWTTTEDHKTVVVSAAAAGPDDDDAVGYTSLVDEENGRPQKTSQSAAAISKTTGTTQQPRRQQQHRQNDLGSSLLPQDVLRDPTVEDSLHQECSFFFAQDDEMPRLSRGFRTVRQDEHQHAFSYKDAVDVLAPTFLKQYKTRYEQLNQDYRDLPPSRNNEEDNSLHLYDESDPNNKNRIICADTAVHSSLFYQHNGRLLMRLPMDQVRLFMDPDLDAGVLSVEQWRQDGDEAGGDKHQLRYVLTISDDLYRRMVADMSSGITRPYWGLTRCCHDNEKADIRIALVILCLVFLIFFICLLIFGPVD